MDQRLAAFQRLLEIMDELRTKCPWDKKQTFETLRYLTIEETYELSEAILDKKDEDIRKEIGDLLLHIVFYAKLGEEAHKFDIQSIIEGLNEKLIRRHPHIFGDVKAETADEVRVNWEKIKLKEGSKSVLGGVPKSLPAVIKAERIQEKAAGVGFDWNCSAEVFDKICEEITEFKDEVKQNNRDKMESEFGDILFALINYARFIHINPENALEKTNRKFITRFNYMEEQAKLSHKAIHEMSLEEMENLWQESKQYEL